MSFVSEIRRRNVVKVAIAYAALTWLLVQIAIGIEEPLSLPGWFDTLVIVLLAVGFPVALVLAWAFELTPEGIRATESVEREPGAPRKTGTTLNLITIGVLAAAVIVLVTDRILLDDQDGTIPNSIAVLPFENLSPDRGDAYFAPGLHEEILNRLQKIQQLTVIARTTMSQYENTDKTIPEIAAELNVATVMEATVRYASNRVRVTAQLIDPGTGGHLWSDTYDREFDDIFAIESDIAMSVANAMAIEFSLDELQRIDAIPTDSVDAYGLYLDALALSGNLAAAADALESVDAAIAADPDFAEAWTLKAKLHGNVALGLPANLAVAEQAARYPAILRAIELDPDSADAYSVLALARAASGEWVEAESAYRRAMALGDRRSLYRGDSHIVRMAVGDTSGANEILNVGSRSDPLNQNGRAFFVWTLGLMGDIARAEEEYGSATRLFGEPWFGSFYVSFVRLGTLRTVSPADMPADEVGGIQGIVIANWESPDRAVEELRRVYRSDETLGQGVLVRIANWAAHLGDTEFGLEVLERLLSLNGLHAYWFWAPHMRDVRQSPGFRSLVREVGLVDYWNEFGWPELCEPGAGDDFACR